jgi:hypothetical protein
MNAFLPHAGSARVVKSGLRPGFTQDDQSDKGNEPHPVSHPYLP